VDVVIFATLVLSFALLATSHIALAAGLLFRQPRWRGPVALLVAPLAPYWGVAERMYVRSATWLVALVVYVVTLLAAA
jgi:hypothetical protein